MGDDKLTLTDIMKSYPLSNLTSDEADAIAFFILDELKKNNDMVGLKQFGKMINDEIKRRTLL